MDDREVEFTTLDAADCSIMHVGNLRQLFLRKTRLFSKKTHVAANLPQLGSPLAPINPIRHAIELNRHPP